jgi:hypothetical protein
VSPGSRKRRRLRIRRGRPDGRPPGESGYKGPDVPVDTVAEFGCCAVEAVGSLAILLGLVLVPALLYLN